jgi:hypothetical protein
MMISVQVARAAAASPPLQSALRIQKQFVVVCYQFGSAGSSSGSHFPRLEPQATGGPLH